MIGGTVSGIPDLRAALAGIVPKLRVRALANALRAGARIVQKTARAATPVISPAAPAVRKGYRKPGTVRKAISVRTSKIARRRGDVGIFVNVRPLPGAKYKSIKGLFGIKRRVQVRASKRGSKNPDDPFYWRFIEFGTKARAAGERSSYSTGGKLKTRRHKRKTGSTKAAEFLQKGGKRLPASLQEFIRYIGPQIRKLNQPKAPAP